MVHQYQHQHPTFSSDVHHEPHVPMLHGRHDDVFVVLRHYSAHHWWGRMVIDNAGCYMPFRHAHLPSYASSSPPLLSNSCLHPSAFPATEILEMLRQRSLELTQIPHRPAEDDSAPIPVLWQLWMLFSILV